MFNTGKWQQKKHSMRNGGGDEKDSYVRLSEWQFIFGVAAFVLQSQNLKKHVKSRSQNKKCKNRKMQRKLSALGRSGFLEKLQPFCT